MVNEKDIIGAVARFNNPKRNWSGLCEAAIWNLFNVLGTSGPSSSSATAARKRSKIEGSGWGPGNNVVWWSGVWGYENGKNVDFGHVAYHLGNGWAFMASSSVTTTIPGFTNIGFVDLNRYEKRFPNMKREGWSYDHAGAFLYPPTPPNPDNLGEEDMATLQQLEDKLNTVLAGIEDLQHVKHNGVDTLTDIVLADTFLTVRELRTRLINTEGKVDRIRETLAEGDTPVAEEAPTA